MLTEENTIKSRLKTEEKAYLAGLFDGEGCIWGGFHSKSFESKKEKRQKVTTWVDVYFIISNNEYALLKYVQQMLCCGDIYPKTVNPKRPTNNYSYRISKQCDIFNVIDAIDQYVIIKKTQLMKAKILLAYLGGRQRAKWTPEERDFAHKTYLKGLEKRSSHGIRTGRKPKHSLSDLGIT